MNNKKESVNDITQDVKEVLLSIRDEMDDHLDAINSNTSEIQSNYEFLSEVDRKLDKLSQRIEKIEMFLDMEENHKEVVSCPLTIEEKEIFLSLYTESDKKPLTYENIGNKVGLSPFLVQNYVTNMVAKGIPIQKIFQNNIVLLKLSPQFKERQAKENILQI